MASMTKDGRERRPTGAAARSRETNQLLGSIGGNEHWATLHGEARSAATAKARANGPGELDPYWFDRVDPERQMSEADRVKCAQNAKKAHFSRLALAAAKSRRKSPSPPSDETATAAPETGAA